MPTSNMIGWGIAGAATTMLVRTATRSALHDDTGAPRLPRSARGNVSFSMMLVLAAAAGALLAMGDVLKEQRKNVTHNSASGAF